MIYKELSPKEISYLSSTYLFVRGKGISEICFLDRGGDSSVNLYTKNSLTSGTKHYKIDNKIIRGFEFHQPETGWLLFGQSPYYFERIPSRTWKLGLSRENVNDNSFMRLHREDQIIDALTNLKQRLYPSYEEAKNISQKSQSQIPFSRFYSTYKGGIYYKENYIGQEENLIFNNESEKSFHTFNIESLIPGMRYSVSAPKMIDYDGDL